MFTLQRDRDFLNFNYLTLFNKANLNLRTTLKPQEPIEGLEPTTC
jgi:hypothetical protein